MGPLTEATASRTAVVERRLVRLSQRDHRTALSTDHSSIGLEGVSGQRRRSKWRVRPGQCLALPDLLSHELSRGQATGVYQRSSGLRSMAHPKWLIAISFNLHRLQLDGSRCKLMSAMLRTLLRVIEVNPILLGALPAGIVLLVTKRKQRLGDLLAGTVVISNKILPETAINDNK